MRQAHHALTGRHRTHLATAAAITVAAALFGCETGSPLSDLDRARNGFSWDTDLQARGTFETIDYESLDPGTIVSEVFGSGGSGPIAVHGTNPFFADGVNAAVVFDSSNPTGGDSDLGTPAGSCGGPGDGGADVGLGTPYENCEALGHIIMVAADLVDGNGDSLVDDPDDIDVVAADGVTIAYDFSAIGTVTVSSITVIDIDGNNPDPRVELFDGDDVLLATFPIPNDMPENGVATVSLGNTAGVVKMVVWLQGSGGFDTILFTPDRDEEPVGCRVTGGGVDSFDTQGAGGELFRGGTPDGANRYQFGGQAGAPTGSQPQPWGEWTHHQQQGPDGSFIFHAGTASAPETTEIDWISCSDPGFCFPARPAPTKQIDFEGLGTFRNIRNPSAALADVVPGETFHWFEVHIEDLGEPGPGGEHGELDDALCPPAGRDGLSGDYASCECDDFYRITIYAGVPQFEEPNKTDVIYEVYGYLDGGNLQIHPPID